MRDNIVHPKGCYVDGHWGQYATRQMVQVARDFGYQLSVEETIIMHKAYHTDTLSEDEIASVYEAITEMADEAETWLNEAIAEPGYYFGWHDGEFFYWSEAEWDE